MSIHVQTIESFRSLLRETGAQVSLPNGAVKYGAGADIFWVLPKDNYITFRMEDDKIDIIEIAITDTTEVRHKAAWFAENISYLLMGGK